jgi:hypothetical protein
MAKFPMQLNREFAVIEQGILESNQGSRPCLRQLLSRVAQSKRRD